MTEQLTFLPKHKHLKYVITNPIEVFETSQGDFTLMAVIDFDRNKAPILYPFGNNSYETSKQAERAIMAKTYDVDPDLVSFCQNHSDEFRHPALSITYPHVDKIDGDWVITSHFKEYQDDEQDIIGINSFLSEESWSSKKEAEKAMNDGDYTLLWEVTIPFSAIARNTLGLVKELETGKIFIVRPYTSLVMKGLNNYTDKDYAMFDYHERLVEHFDAIEDARSYLQEYLEGLKVKLPESTQV